MKRLGLLVILVGGCVVPDADVAGGAVASLTATPSASSVNVFTVHVTGSAKVKYTSSEPAVVDIAVGGAVVVEQALDVSTSLDAAIDADVPLAAGPNAIDVTLTYRGESLTQRFSVDAAMTAPTITLPTWTPAYTAHQGLDESGTITVAADSAYKVSAVAVSLDGEPWIPATDNGSGGWDVTIPDPDIGDSDVAVRATTTVDGQSADTTVHGVLHVDPVFDCAAPATSMLPSADLLRNNGTEQRVMVGYFGRADGGHDVTFVLDGVAQDPINASVSVVSTTTAYGATEIHASWNVQILRCNNNQATCSLPYNLTAYVDGVQICSHQAFGNVISLF